MKDKKPKTPSNLVFKDVAWKIQAQAEEQKLFLMFLTNHVNANGATWHSYNSIQLHTQIGAGKTVKKMRDYLRDELGIMTWEQGHQHKSNEYRFNLNKMKELAERQASLNNPAVSLAGC